MSKKRIRSRLIGYRGFRKEGEKNREGNSTWSELSSHLYKTVADCKSAGARKCVPVFDRQR